MCVSALTKIRTRGRSSLATKTDNGTRLRSLPCHACNQPGHVSVDWPTEYGTKAGNLLMGLSLGGCYHGCGRLLSRHGGTFWMCISGAAQGEKQALA